MSDDNRSESGLSSESWTALRPGARFVVRHRLPEGESHALTDVVGTVLRVSEDTVELQSRSRGNVTVDRPDVIIVKEIPATPGRRGQPHRAVGLEDLERLAVDGWAPTHRSQLGEWTLRAAGGYTGRANSALAVGQPDRPLNTALEAVRHWYAELGEPPLVQVPLSPGFAPDDDPLVVDARQHGWSWFQLADVMTASASEVATACSTARSVGTGSSPRAQVVIETGPDLTQAWWSLADERMLEHPDGARAVLTGSPQQTFVTLLSDGVPSARARIAFVHGWGGLYALATVPEARGRGLGTKLVAACAEAAKEQGVPSLYLQVSADNAAAISLYEHLGFTRHHQYVYLRHDDVTRS